MLIFQAPWIKSGQGFLKEGFLKINFKVIAILAAFLVVAFFNDLSGFIESLRGLYPSYPWYVANYLLGLFEVMFVFLATFIIFRPALSALPEMLGLNRNPIIGLGFSLLCVVPLYMVFVFSFPVSQTLDFKEISYLAFGGPFAEELVFRAFAFGLLIRVGFNFWGAALIPAILFGVGHLSTGMELSEALGVFAITGIGSLFFSWLYLKWDNNLWLIFFVHALMNLAWNIWNVGESAFAGWLPTTMQVTTLVVAILLTLNKEKIPWLKSAS